MMTEEGRLKAEIKKHLQTLPRCKWDMPVTQGYGSQLVDFICCINGRYTAIEAKAPGKKPSPRQNKFLKDTVDAGGAALWCDSFEGYLMGMALWGFINQP